MWQVVRVEGFSRCILQIFSQESNARAYRAEQDRLASLQTDGIPKERYDVEEIKNV